MPMRVAKRVVDTSAKGQDFKKNETEVYKRYQVGVTLVSLKTVAKSDLFNRTNEFYFKVKSPEKTLKSRTPDEGTINLRENQVYQPRADKLTLWSQFPMFMTSDEKTVPLHIELREADVGKRDDRVAVIDLVIKCPSKSEYIILQDDKEETKAKLKIYATETRY